MDKKDVECAICGGDVIPANDGCSTINQKWVHNDCIIGSEINLKYMLDQK